MPRSEKTLPKTTRLPVMYVLPEGPAKMFDVTTRFPTLESLATFKFIAKIESPFRVRILPVVIFAVTRFEFVAKIERPLRVTTFSVPTFALTRFEFVAKIERPLRVTTFSVPTFAVTRFEFVAKIEVKLAVRPLRVVKFVVPMTLRAEMLAVVVTFIYGMIRVSK